MMTDWDWDQIAAEGQAWAESGTFAPSTGAMDEPHTWVPRDLRPVLDGEIQRLQPTILARNDEQRLFYPGKLHWVYGEPEAGKGWLVLAAVAEQLRAGAHVIYFDFEDDEHGLVGRLLDLGIERWVILDRFHYYRPEEASTEFARQGLEAFIEGIGATLVVFDGVTEGMELEGLDNERNREISRWIRLLPKRLAGLGAAVVCIDHVTKNKDTRGRYMLGGGHKLAAVSGASYAVEAIQPFTKGQEGKSKVTITKDRPGVIRNACSGGKRDYVGMFHLASDEDGRITRIEIVAGGASTANTPAWRPTQIMEAASRALEKHPQGLTKTAWRQLFQGKNETRGDAMDYLIEDGYVVVEIVGSSPRCKSIRPYRAPAERGDG